MPMDGTRVVAPIDTGTNVDGNGCADAIFNMPSIRCVPFNPAPATTVNVVAAELIAMK